MTKSLLYVLFWDLIGAAPGVKQWRASFSTPLHTFMPIDGLTFAIA